MLDLSNLEQIKMGGISKGNQIKFYHNGYRHLPLEKKKELIKKITGF